MSEEQVEYQNRCGRHVEFHDGCGQCTGNATEEFLLGRASSITELKDRNDDIPWSKEKAETIRSAVMGTSASLPINLGMTEEWRVNINIRPEDLANRLIDEGVKYDDDKPRYDLIPARPLEELAKVYTVGAKKYADRNWEKGMRWGRVFAAMMRHAWAWWTGETYDKESKVHHMAAVAWGAFALMEYDLSSPQIGGDDRPVPPGYLPEPKPVSLEGEWNYKVLLPPGYLPPGYLPPGSQMSYFVDRAEAIAFAISETNRGAPWAQVASKDEEIVAKIGI